MRFSTLKKRYPKSNFLEHKHGYTQSWEEGHNIQITIVFLLILSALGFLIFSINYPLVYRIWTMIIAMPVIIIAGLLGGYRIAGTVFGPHRSLGWVLSRWIATSLILTFLYIGLSIISPKILIDNNMPLALGNSSENAMRE